MHPSNHIQSILKKFILNKCNKQEIEEVIAYIQSLKESSQIPSVEEVLELLDEKQIVELEVANRIHDDILKISKRQTTKPTKKKNYIWRYTAAAILVGILATSYFFRDSFFNNDLESSTPIIVNTNTIIPGTDKATLTLEDGSVVVLEKGNTFKTKNASSNGEEIVYEASKDKSVEIAYNYLTIPRGGQYHVKLADGTEVWLNSETQLKYPTSFIEGEERKVELVYGEAYFDVSHSINHKGSKFRVINNAQEVEVLGTEFNIKAYKDETRIYTTLVEGKVTIDNGILKQNLTPNQQSNLNILNSSMTIAVVDVEGEISWKRGIFSFKGKPLKDIMKVISRWYDVDVVFVNKDLESVKFKGNLNKNQSIERILSIMLSSKLDKYEIKNKTILLK
ncbi:FecR family protein [Flavivirga spongiicola]|uniref:DUF4974 domain-containing protein n=1 Tax=Flavivirga spongiicola TaxID=421621 RepID=A0ABU7XTB5_9FLAO|nr:FecR family protein [Flavivirga sp. MEBiC05379]MDO5979001.1 DUF4974 domain-containing protein [Flavivirga sp. MEBiC05379]